MTSFNRLLVDTRNQTNNNTEVITNNSIIGMEIHIGATLDTLPTPDKYNPTKTINNTNDPKNIFLTILFL